MLSRSAIGAAILAVLAISTTTPIAAAGPKDGPNALQVITSLQRQGDVVVVKRTGSKPLQYCVVTSIHKGKSEYWWTRPRLIDPNPAKRPPAIGSVLMTRTVYVDIRC